MEKVKQAIDDARNIKANSLRAYVISLNKVHNAIKNNYNFDKQHPLDFLKDEKKVLESIKDLKVNTQKNYLSAIIVGLDAMNDKGRYDKDLKEYREYLDELNKEVMKELEKNEKTENQKENWVSLKELRKVMNGYKRDLIDRDVFKKETITKKQRDILQMWVVANLYIGSDENAPIRLDYGGSLVVKNSDYEKLKEDDLESNNYLVVKSRTKKFFHFGEYKSKKAHGIKKIPVGRILNSVLNIWLKFNDSGNLLVDSRDKPMNSNQLSKYITKTFKPTGKKVTLNLIRHVYISEKHPVSVNDSKEKTADLMMHSTDMQSKYAKR
tara:strand:- start:8150 stop:9121 length:972 start_codon:yes stop_codon:yes gene_type:complete